MRSLLTITLLLSCLLSSAQSENPQMIQVDTVINEYSGNGPGSGTYYAQAWTVRFSYPADGTRRPTLAYINGSGEVGTDTTNIVAYGPYYWKNNGWDGGVQLGNGKHYPCLLGIEQPQQNERPWHLQALLDTIFAHYPQLYLPGSFHTAGLSQGSYEWGELIAYAAYAGDETAMAMIRSWVDLEGVGPGDNFSGFNQPYPAVYGIWAQLYGGRFFGQEGIQDTRNIWQISEAMNAAVANSAYFAYENIGGGQHCCWNNMYDPTMVNWVCVGDITNPNIVSFSSPANTMGDYSTGNIFQWMLRQGDTSLKLPAILTVTFVSFTGQPTAGGIRLTWVTAQESNSDHFEIERSEDGTSWSTVGSLPAAGNSSLPITYSFTDTI